MPKEITYSTTDATFLLMPDGSEHPESSDEANALRHKPEAGGKWNRRGVHVGWAKDRYVEIGVASFDPAHERSPGEGVFMSLDRDAINRLIRSLRKARDAGFGSDA